jgi:iron complex transport system substrate-binding protein
MRLISICPSNTELVYYLDLGHTLVGVDDFSDWPSSIVAPLPKLGPDLSIDMDKVERLKPDLVLASLSVPGMEKNVDELKRRGIPFHIFNPHSLKDIANDILTLGTLTNSFDKAQLIHSHFNEIVTTYQTISSTIVTKPSLYWEWWPKPIFTPGGKNWLTEISELAGAKNIFSDQNEASVQTSWEEVIGRKPDHICLAWVGVNQNKMKPAIIKKRPMAMALASVRNNRIHVLEEHLFCRPSPRLIEGLQKLALLIHPDKYPLLN